MWIVNLTTNPNGSHNDHRADHITTVPEGWAMIPDDFQLPASYPFGEITAEEVTYTREVEVEKEVTKTREIETVDPEGNPITITEEYKEMERVAEKRPYTMMTVISMTEGEVPPAPEPEPTWNERMEAQTTYTAMMTDTLLTAEMPALLTEESMMYDKLSKWYQQHLWTSTMMSNAVAKNIITANEYNDITGMDYSIE